MARVQWFDEGTVYKDATGPVLEFLFLQAGGVVVQDLAGWCGFVTFWYPGSAPHVQRAAQVDATNGILRYFPVGDEFPAVGSVRFQAEAMLVDHADGTDQAFFTVCHPVIRRRVVNP
jgi:hypothetical protein